MPYRCYFNGAIARTADTQIQISDLGLLRGYGLFDYFRTYNRQPFQWDWYWERFFSSAQKMRLTIPVSKDEAHRIVLDLIERTHVSDMGVRFVLTGGYSPDSISVVKPNLLIATEELHFTPAIQYEQGIKVILDDYVREMPEVKSTDYKRVILLADDIRAAGASDVLYHKNGEISELSRSNFFIFKGDTLITPNRHILYGITRRVVLQLAQADFRVEERPVLLSDLYDADEAFTTSSTKQLLPITRVDDMRIGDGLPGERTKYLLKRFAEFAEA